MSLLKEQEYIWDVFDELAKTKPAREIKSNLPDEVDNFIIDKIAEALKEHNWNQTKASKSLGIKRTTLIAKCKKYGLFWK
jgi:transcriptional regulator of acetoin/glycerol metabolism